MVKLTAISLCLLLVVHVIAEDATKYSDSQVDEVVASSGDKGIYTTHSETHRPIHVPVYQRYPVNVPHPVPVAVPHYVKVPIPQPYPRYHHVQHKIEVPVYKVIPEIIEKPVPYTVEKPYPVEVEKPFPVQVVKKLEIPVPKPYPVHVVYYKHISEDDPPPQQAKYPQGFSPSQFYYKDQVREETPKKNKFNGSASPSKYKTISNGHAIKYASLQYRPTSNDESFQYRPTSHGSEGKYNNLQYEIEHPSPVKGSQDLYNSLNLGKFSNLQLAGDLSVDPGFPDKFIRLQYGSEISPSAGQYSSLQLGGEISPNLHHDYQYRGY